MAAVKYLIAQLAAHIGDSPAKRRELIAHCNAKLARKIDRRALFRWLKQGALPDSETMIHIMRWMQLDGLIEPGTRESGLFVYTSMLPVKKTAAPARKHGKKRGGK